MTAVPRPLADPCGRVRMTAARDRPPVLAGSLA